MVYRFFSGILKVKFYKHAAEIVWVVVSPHCLLSSEPCVMVHSRTSGHHLATHRAFIALSVLDTDMECLHLPQKALGTHI